MKLSSVSIIGGGKQENREKLDFYPTPPEVTIALMNFLALPKCTIWECACGDGRMVSVLEQYGHNVIGTDIHSGTDYLTASVKSDAIITNPPFSLSQQFIEKALLEADIVCMLLKIQYWNAKKRYALFNNNKPSYILPLTWRPDFLGGDRGGSPTMDMQWTVWIKGNNKCEFIPLLKPVV